MDSDAPSNSLRERLRQTAAEAMLDSAESEMIRKGYEHATMQEIAAAAGCATGTFYLYFKNKEELFQAIVARHARALFATARAAMDAVPDPIQKLRATTVAHLRYIQQHLPFFRLFFSAIPTRKRSLEHRLSGEARSQRDEYNRIELEVLKQAQKQGKIRTDLSAELLQEFMDAVGFAMVERFAFADDPPSLQQQTRIIWGLMAGGIGVKEDED